MVSTKKTQLWRSYNIWKPSLYFQGNDVTKEFDEYKDKKMNAITVSSLMAQMKIPLNKRADQIIAKVKGPNNDGKISLAGILFDFLNF